MEGEGEEAAECPLGFGSGSEANTVAIKAEALTSALLIAFIAVFSSMIVPIILRSVGYRYRKGSFDQFWAVYALEAFAVGALLGDSFLHQIPHAFHDKSVIEHHDQSCSHSNEYTLVGLAILSGVLAFLFLDVRVRSYAKGSEKSGLAVLNLFADGFHNLMDGLAIGVAFMLRGRSQGFKLAMLVAVHEIPQEIGDTGLLLSSGLVSSLSISTSAVAAAFEIVSDRIQLLKPTQSPMRALMANTLSALMCPVGTTIALLLDVSEYSGQYNAKLVEGFTAGGFLYISLGCAMRDLVDNVENIGHAVLWASLALGVSVTVGIMSYE